MYAHRVYTASFRASKRLCHAPFRGVCKISYSEVVEFQARGAIHVHVPIRLDGPASRDGPPPRLGLSTADLEDPVEAAAGRVNVSSAPLRDGAVYQLRCGAQVDTRAITEGADCEGHGGVVVHQEQVASYLAKYLSKATEDFGLPARVLSAAHARAIGASQHAVGIIAAGERIASENEACGLLLSRLGTLG